MQYKVDWMSFTIPAPAWQEVPVFGLRDAAWEAVGEWAGGWGMTILGNGFWSLEGGRAPFNLSLARDGGGMRLFFSASLSVMLLEISGQGCTIIADEAPILDLLMSFRDACTRLDVACDFETDIKPAEFAASRDVKRFASHGEVVSATGETSYVGSLKSERFARVYRYNPPHPRAHLLRVEHVFRKESAKLSIDYLREHGPVEWLIAIGRVYGWTHELWNIIGSSDAKMVARITERPEEGKTVFWLYKTVVPCLVKQCFEGHLTLEEFLGAVQEEFRKYAPDGTYEGSEEGQDHA